jgi:hypothetical protein
LHKTYLKMHQNTLNINVTNQGCLRFYRCQIIVLVIHLLWRKISSRLYPEKAVWFRAKLGRTLFLLFKVW